MARLWRFRIVLLLVACGLAAPVHSAGSGQAWAETIEFVTYYPAPTAQGSSNMQAAAIGNGYNGVTPDDGELLVFDRVGIGPGFATAQPAGRLHVAGGANETTNALFMPGTGGNIRVGIGTANPKTALDVRQHLNLEDVNGAGVIYFRNTQINPQVPIGLFIRSDNDPTTFEAASERMFIGANGNVGIGTTTPSTKLDVNEGVLRLRHGAQGTTGGAVIEMGNRRPGWGLGLAWNTFFNGASWVYRNTDFAAILSLGDGVNQGDLTYWSAPSGGVGAITPLTPQFKITNSGNVGIGTTAPQQRLHVYQPTAGVWATQIQSNHYALYANASTFGLYGAATSTGGIATYGINTAYGTQGGFGWGSHAMYAYSPSSGNWAGNVHGINYGLLGQSSTYWGYPIYASNAASGYWTILAHGNYGVYTNGYVYGALGAWSTIKRKKNIVTLSPQEESSILSRIQELRLVHYRFKTDAEDHPFRLGVIAEETPTELTFEDRQALDIAAYATYSIAGVKALSAQVKKQQETIETQQREIQQLKQQFQQLQRENAR